MNIVKVLHDFPGVGQIVYSRPRSVTAPENNYLQSTILQLIASGIIEIKLPDKDTKAQCCLSSRDEDWSPTYLDAIYWSKFVLI